MIKVSLISFKPFVLPKTLNCSIKRIFMLEYEGIKLELSPEVYPPEEDTLLFLEALKKEDFKKEEEALEVGCGCGLLSLYLAKHIKHATGIDINGKAVELSEKNARLNKMENVNFFVSDMFSGIKKTFDIILFNPPYIPATERPLQKIDLSYHGGRDGRFLTLRFLKAFPDYLKKGGRAYLLQSSLSGIKDTLGFLEKKGYRVKILSEKNLFLEKLVVLKVML